jgi:hypothetical protein
LKQQNPEFDVEELLEKLELELIRVRHYSGRLVPCTDENPES